jgi:hypothetical protein
LPRRPQKIRHNGFLSRRSNIDLDDVRDAIINSLRDVEPAEFPRPTGQHHPPQTPCTEKARISNPGFSEKRLELGYASF